MRGHTWVWHRTAALEAATISGQERHSHGRFWSPGPKQREDAEMKTHLMARTHPPTNGSPARRLRYRREQGWLCLVPLMPAFTPTPPGTALGCGRASTAVPARGRLLQAAARPTRPGPGRRCWPRPRAGHFPQFGLFPPATSSRGAPRVKLRLMARAQPAPEQETLSVQRTASSGASAESGACVRAV